MSRQPGSQRAPSGRFAPRYSELELLTIVRAVCELVMRLQGIVLEAVTQDRYDASIPASEYPTSPRAFRIVERFNAGWADIREVAFREGPQLAAGQAALVRSEQAPFTLEQAARAVKAIAVRLGANTLRPVEYDAELAVFIEEMTRAWAHGRASRSDWPNSARISVAFDWDDVLEAAGLEKRQPTPPPQSSTKALGTTWTCEASLRSLLQLLAEQEQGQPGTTLTQRDYQRRQRGRIDLAPSSAVGRAAKELGTTFSALRAELVAWRLKGVTGEPALFAKARQRDAELEIERSGPKRIASAHAARSGRARTNDDEVFEALTKIAAPAKCAEVASALGWPAAKTSKSLHRLRLAGRVTITKTRNGPRSARWRVA